MKIKICPKRESAIEEVLKKVQGKASTRKVSYSSIYNFSLQREKESQTILPKKFLKGTIAEFYPPQVPNSYKYPAEGTYFKIERGSSGWFLIEVKRTSCGSCSFGSCSSHSISFTLNQQEKIVEKHPYLYNIHKEFQNLKAIKTAIEISENLKGYN